VFRYIAVPLARPIIGLVGFFAFVASWNNFFLPFVMTYDNSQYPLQIGLQQLIGSTASFNPANYSAGTSVVVLHRPDLAMAAIIAIAPVVIVFMFAQRTLVKGMLAGATKG
jgi:multiple sugar transport system permease protein